MSTVVISLLTLCFVNYFGHLLDPKYTEGAMDAIKAFHLLEDDSLDVIIYGSSHAWKGCDSLEMNKKYGLKAYNYGCNWQAINTTLLFLQDSLRTQSPDVVCVETGLVGKVLEDVELEGQIYYTRPIDFFQGKKEYLSQCFGSNFGRYLTYYIPLAMFHDNWNKIEAENFKKSHPEKWIKTMGYSGTDIVNSVNLTDFASFTHKDLPRSSVLVLDRMVADCKEKGVKILFYTCPFEGEYKYHSAMEEYSERTGCEYLDLFEHIDEVGIDGETDFRDKDHLNNSGSRKVADYLGRYIVENYDIGKKLYVNETENRTKQ